MFTKLIVKYVDLQFIRNSILNLSLVPAEKRELELSRKSTINYINELIEKHKSSEGDNDLHLIEIELHLSDDLSYIVRDIEKIMKHEKQLSINSLFGCTNAEYRGYELWNLQELLVNTYSNAVKSNASEAA